MQLFSYLAESGLDFGLFAFVVGCVTMVVAWSAYRRLGAMMASAADGSALETRFTNLQEAVARQERVLREELKFSRAEAADGARLLREEVSGGITRLSEGVTAQIRELTALQKGQLGDVSRQLVDISVRQEQRVLENNEAQVQALRDLRDHVARQIADWKLDSGEKSNSLAQTLRTSLDQFGVAMRASTAQLLDQQKAQMEGFEARLNGLADANEQRGLALRATLEAQLGQLREGNEKKLEEMRATVDEKLQGTLEKRLGESFSLVSERLEAVHKGLGEVQTLATGVGDLKRVLTNVKTRGGWGEVQLGALLEQMLAPNQYVANAKTKDIGNERVEYAIRMPGGSDGAEVLLPIDAKFPVEDYERIQAAAELGDLLALEEASKGLANRIKLSAKDISTKYLNPPVTTDFAILFLPTEGLFAEVIRRAGLVDEIQRVHRVVIAGPTTLIALLNSLQMGFKTLQIQKRASEVGQVLGAVKTEFDKFGGVLDSVGKKLAQASNEVENANRRRRAMNKLLSNVERMPDMDAERMIAPLQEDALPDLE